MEHIRGPRIPDHDLSSKAHCFVSNSKGRGGLVVRFLIPFEGGGLILFNNLETGFPRG